jgi:DNA-binding response OmpR family regulator
MPKTVLIVEDDFDTLHPLAELLGLKGYDVSTATDAEQGLQAARKRHPDLIITDIVLPGKSGLHFITSIRGDQIIHSTPILVISGCGPMVLVEAESAGADCCLQKPIQIDVFWAAIDQVFGSNNYRQVETKVVEPGVDAGRALAGEIDRLVEELRDCSSKDDKEEVLKRLKERILKLQAHHTNCA